MLENLKEKIENGTATVEEIKQIIEAVDQGTLRVADKVNGSWQINAWVKKAILKYFVSCQVEETRVGEFYFRDKVPLKQKFENVRIVPGGNSLRYGSFLGSNVIMMPPSYVNIGVYVDEGTMIDSHVLVGSCAQIGKNVHLSAGVQVGGVLEPANAQPVIIEDNAFVGAGVMVVEGFLIREGAVIAPGVVLSASTKVIETDKDGKIIGQYEGEIPANAIVVPGARPRGEIMVQTPVIIGYKNEKTASKVELTDFLRQF